MAAGHGGGTLAARDAFPPSRAGTGACNSDAAGWLAGKEDGGAQQLGAYDGGGISQYETPPCPWHAVWRERLVV